MRELRKKLTKRAVIYSSLIAVVSLFINKFFSAGIVLGTAASILNLYLLERQIQTLVGEKYNLFFGFFGYIIRFLLMGLSLFFSIKINTVMFFGCAIGLFMARIAIFSEQKPLSLKDKDQGSLPVDQQNDVEIMSDT